MKLVETIETTPGQDRATGSAARAVSANTMMLLKALGNLADHRPAEVLEPDQLYWDAIDRLCKLLGCAPTTTSAEIRSFARQLEAAARSTDSDPAIIATYAEYLENCYFVVRDIANRFHVKNRAKRVEGGNSGSGSTIVLPDLYRLGSLKSENRLVQLLECISGQCVLVSTPSRITIEPSSMCNFSCAMCPQGMYEGRPQFNELGSAQIANLADFFPALYSLGVQVIGEPTLSAQLKPLAELARSNNVGIDMITNGSMLHNTDAPMEGFASICISFDGATKDVFEAHRIGANFEQIIRNIRTLRSQASMVRIEFNVCVTRLNMDQVPEIARIGADLGVDLIRFSPLQTSRSTTTQIQMLFHLDDLVLKDDEMAKLFSLIDDAKKIGSEGGVRIINTFAEFHSNPDRDNRLDQAEMISGLLAVDREKKAKVMPVLVERLSALVGDIPTGLEVLCRRAVGHEGQAATPVKKVATTGSQRVPVAQSNSMRGAFDSLHKQLSKSSPQEPDGKSANRRISLPYCSAPWVGGLVFSTGDYVPCCYLAGEDFGDVNETPAREFWNNQRLTELRGQLAESSDAMPKTCRNCNALQRYQFVGQMLEHISYLGYEWDDIDWPANFNPIPAHVAQIKEIRQRLFSGEGKRLLNVGDAIDFSDPASDPYIAFGFGATQPAGRWSESSMAAIVFELDEELERNADLRLDLTVLPFVDKDIALTQIVEFSVNGEPLFEKELTNPGLSYIELTVPGAILKRGLNRIVMDLPHAVSPHAIGKNKNWALRAVLIKQLERRA
jgi:MoaA/NifB/PqqE/SkfB family radical SAM enzyme